MQLNKDNFKSEIEDFSGLALVDFFAPWCGPCQLMAPIINKLADEYKDKNIKIAKLNIDNNNEIAQKYKVMSIPTLILFNKGQVIEKVVGYMAEEDLKGLIEKNI